MNTQWTIEQLIRKTDTGAVITAHWRATATDGELSATAIGTAGFEPDPDAPGFVPFEQLTEAQVVSWVQGTLGDEVPALEAKLAAEIDEKRTPPVVPGLPWATETNPQPQGENA